MMPDKERRKNKGVSITKPELRFDKFMDTVSRSKLGKVFAAITGISLVVASADSACTNAQPITKPAETAPVPGGTPTEVSTEVPTETKAPTMTATVTNTETPSLTPTPEGPDYSRVFFDPQSETDFSKVIEAPSPIDDPAGFAVWQDGYLAAITEKLKTYTGPSIGIGGAGIAYDSAIIVLSSVSWPVIASFRFTWQGQEILTKTYIVNDGQGNLVPLSLTYTTPNSNWFVTKDGYNDPSKQKGMCYEWTSETAKYVDDKFAASFMPNGQEYTGFDSIQRFIIGTSTQADREMVSRERFLQTYP